MKETNHWRKTPRTTYAHAKDASLQSYWLVLHLMSWSSAKGLSACLPSRLALPAFSASCLASARVRFALIVAACSSDSLCIVHGRCALSAERCPSVRQPSRPSLGAEVEDQDFCLCVQLVLSRVFLHFATWFRCVPGCSEVQRASAAKASIAFRPSRPNRP